MIAEPKKEELFELEAQPPDLRDLPRSCHPRLESQSRNRRVGG